MAIIAIYNLDAVKDKLELVVKRKGRVVKDALALMNHINDVLIRSGEDASAYFKLNDDELAAELDLTPRQVSNAKSRLSEAGVIAALPPFKNGNSWVNLWKLQVLPTETLGTIVMVNRIGSHRTVTHLQSLPPNEEKGYLHFLGTHFRNQELESHWSSVAGFWENENFRSPEERKFTALKAAAELEEIVRSSDKTAYRLAWDERCKPVDLSELDEMMAAW